MTSQTSDTAPPSSQTGVPRCRSLCRSSRKANQDGAAPWGARAIAMVPARLLPIEGERLMRKRIRLPAEYRSWGPPLEPDILFIGLIRLVVRTRLLVQRVRGLLSRPTGTPAQLSAVRARCSAYARRGRRST